MNSNRFASKKEFDYSGWKVTPLDPNDLGRRSEALDQAQEVPIRADHCGKLGSPRPMKNKRIG
jgi:hypothetical protein